MADCRLDCETAMRQLFDYLDDELTEERMVLVREHLELCALCCPHYDFLRAILDALPATRTTAEAPAAVRERVLATLHEAGFTRV
ncbi:MAG: anti-sigma factor family protein [Gemmatimonadaceae bacterium]